MLWVEEKYYFLLSHMFAKANCGAMNCLAQFGELSDEVKSVKIDTLRRAEDVERHAKGVDSRTQHRQAGS